jgi:hypothetical protein
VLTPAARTCLRRGRLPGLIAAALTLALAASAFASVAGLTVASKHWQIGINNGPNHKVKSGGTFHYCATKTVGVITPEINLSATPAGADESFTLTGPRAAGASLPTDEGNFSGSPDMVSPEFIPLSFPKLKAEEAASFPTGTYVFTLSVGGAPAVSEKVKIARRAGC